MALLTSYWSLDGVLVLLSLIFAAYLYMTRNFKYWANRGVMEIKPTPFVGNFGDFILARLSPAELFGDLYKKSKGLKYMGFYIFDRPNFLPRDPTLVKHILTKDFKYFSDRFLAETKTDDLGTHNLFLLKNPHWKDLRNKMTPLFSLGKVKKMFPLVTAVTDDLKSHLEDFGLHGEGRVIELKETCARFTTDIIGSCAYGLKLNCLKNPDSEFRHYGRKIFSFGLRRSIEAMAFYFVPGLVEPINFKFLEKSCSIYLRKVFWAAINQRMQSGEHRNDLIDTLIELKEKQEATDINDPQAFQFTGDNLVSQAALFFIAGFETSSTAMSFAIYELALHRHVQSRLRDEITSALDESEGKLSYESVRIFHGLIPKLLNNDLLDNAKQVMSLPYLDMVVSETLRKYPSVPFLNRVAVSDYKVPGADLVIEKGTPVIIPTLGLHYDPEYYPDPQGFDPERFNEENKQTRPSCSYLPFGEGPHNCIGLRFGLLQVKLGLIEIFSAYEVTPCDKTMIPLRFEPRAVVLASEGGLYLNIRKI